MTKQLSFAKGEIAPSLYARTDLASYATSLRTLRNFFTAKQGGAYNRPGTTFVSEVKDSSKAVRLVEFAFGADDAYILEFGEYYMRVFRNRAAVLVTGSDVSAWSSATAYAIGDMASFGGVNYYCSTAHSNHTPPNLNFWYPFTGDIFEIPTPYSESELSEFQFLPFDDIMIFVHEDHPPKELIRRGHVQWTFTDIVFTPSIATPVASVFSPAPITPGFPLITYTITAVGVDGEESLPLSDIGRHQTNTHASSVNIGWADVAGAVQYNIYRNVTSIGATSYGLTEGLIGTSVKSNFSDSGQEADLGTPPINPNPFQTVNNYPSVAKFSQQSLFLAATINSPERVWKSRIGSYKNFATRLPVQDDDPVIFTLVGNQINKIRHILELRQTVCLTSSVEWAIEGDAAGILRPDSINAKRHSYSGASQIPPISVGRNALYIQARGTVIRDLGFAFEDDGYDGNDLTIFSSHLFAGKTIVDWAYSQIPNYLVWVVLSDGTFLSLTYLKEQEMLSWARHDTDGLVENVAVIPDGEEDRLYLVVKRTINGQTKRYIEMLNTREIDEIEDAIFLDSTLSYDGTAVSTVGGLSHLEGREVAILADGFVVASPNNKSYQKRIVSGGTVTLDRAYSKIHVGLPYISDIETLDSPSYINEKKIVTGIKAFVEKTRGFFSGAAAPTDNPLDGLRETKLRTTESLNEPVSLHTEEVPLNIPGKWTQGGRVFIRNVDPLPVAVLSLTPLGYQPNQGR